jgi:ATP-binding cassette subfamily B protein
MAAQERGDATRSAEAGRAALAALAFAAQRCGVDLLAEELVREHGGAAAIEPGGLVAIAARHGLEARIVRLEGADLASAGGAVLLPLEDGGWRLLDGVERRGDVLILHLRDPLAPGRPCERTDPLTLSERWSGKAILLRKRPAADGLDRPFGLGWMLAQVARERRLFRDIALAALAAGFLSLAPPLFYMVVVDRVLVHQRGSTLAVLLLAIAVALAFDTALGFVRRQLVAHAAARIDARIGLHLFDRLIGLPMEFFERRPTGEIVHKLAEVRRVRAFLTGQLMNVVLDTGALAVLVPAMFVLSAPLAWLVLGLVGLMAAIVALYMGPMRAAYARLVEAEQRRSAFLVETVAGMRTVKALALEPLRRRTWDTLAAASIREATRLQLLANQPQTLLQPLEKLVFAGALALGAWLAVSGQATVLAGTLVAFTMIAGRATQPLVQLAGLMQQLQEVRGALAQVASVIDHPPERRRRVGVRPELTGAVRFERVRFRYPGSVRPALDDVSFTIEPGQMVGIMGRSGSGKTTITRLLQGLHDDYEGLIRLDGVELREIELRHLRTRVGVVLQDSFLFQGTIRENILAGRPDASPEEVVEAARLAGAEEFIARLPRGFDSPVEEGSSNLSGGQRQRLAIARVLLMRPSILVLDEATSALDPDSEALVNAGLRRIAQGRTLIVVSHRLASLVDCHQILVLDDGRLVDAGRHAELLARCELYRHLWLVQNRHLQPAANVPFRIGGPREPARVA